MPSTSADILNQTTSSHFKGYVHTTRKRKVFLFSHLWLDSSGWKPVCPCRLIENQPKWRGEWRNGLGIVLVKWFQTGPNFPSCTRSRPTDKPTKHRFNYISIYSFCQPLCCFLNYASQKENKINRVQLGLKIQRQDYNSCHYACRLLFFKADNGNWFHSKHMAAILIIN